MDTQFWLLLFAWGGAFCALLLLIAHRVPLNPDWAGSRPRAKTAD